MAHLTSTDRILIDAMHAAAREKPRSALCLLLDATDMLTKKNTWADAASFTLIQTLGDANTLREAARDDDVTHALYGDLYYTIAPHVSFSKGFMRSMTAGVKRWTKKVDLDQMTWGLHLTYGHSDPLAYLQNESDTFDACMDPENTVYGLSDAFFKRSPDYTALAYDTMDFPQTNDKQQAFDHLDQAYRHTDKRAYYSLKTDQVYFRRACFHQKPETFHATDKQTKDPARLMRFIENAHFAGAENGDCFYMTQLRKADQAKIILGHEKIHQHHMRRYMTALQDPQARRRVHMSCDDVVLTTVSKACLTPQNQHRRAANKTETLIADIWAQTILADKIKEAFVPV